MSYWSATTYASDPGPAFAGTLYFYNGTVYPIYKLSACTICDTGYVRAVRSAL